jgi:hypothetical protein
MNYANGSVIQLMASARALTVSFTVMCEKCAEFDKRIAHYRELSMRTTDQPTLEGIALLIKQYEAQKRELHPEPKE